VDGPGKEEPMLVAVLSDTHDNIWKLDAALPHIQRAEAVVHCGDLCSPFLLRMLAEGVQGRGLHVVWGNNDGDRLLLTRVAGGFEGVHLYGQFAEVELGGVAAAVNHYPEIAHGMALSGKYRLVCYGHNHTAREQRIGDCLLLNPGELAGIQGRSTIALVDTTDLRVEWVDV
jgi:putative phosphoesterase